MKKFLGLVLVATFFGCGKDMKSGKGAANVFEPTEVVTKNTEEYFWPKMKCISEQKTPGNSQLDARLAKGQVFTSISLDKEYDSAQTVQRDQVIIESINFQENSYTFLMNINYQGNTGWLKGRRDFVFGQTFGGSETTYFDASPNYKPMLEKIESGDEEGGVYWGCNIFGKSSADEQLKVEIGKYTLTSGKKVNATRAERITKGEITCIKYSRKPYKKGEIPEPAEQIEVRNLGLGEYIEISMQSTDIPNKDGCSDEGMELESSRIIVDASKKTIQSDVERLENAVY
ncbi:hypothetical protein K2X05_08230 [bacterium]|nr:hypothetical protein [bacterium]